MAKKLDYFVLANGKSPFLEWMEELEYRTQIVIDRFLQRMAQGGAKKLVKSLKNGLFEIKVDHGPGYILVEF